MSLLLESMDEAVKMSACESWCHARTAFPGARRDTAVLGHQAADAEGRAMRCAGGAPHPERTAACSGDGTPADAAWQPWPGAVSQQPEHATPSRAGRPEAAAAGSPVFTSTFVVGHAATAADGVPSQMQGMRSPLSEVHLPGVGRGGPHWAGSSNAQRSPSLSKVLAKSPCPAKPRADATPPLQACLSPQLGAARVGGSSQEERRSDEEARRSVSRKRPPARQAPGGTPPPQGTATLGYPPQMDVSRCNLHGSPASPAHRGGDAGSAHCNAAGDSGERQLRLFEPSGHGEGFGAAPGVSTPGSRGLQVSVPRLDLSRSGSLRISLEATTPPCSFPLGGRRAAGAAKFGADSGNGVRDPAGGDALQGAAEEGAHSDAAGGCDQAETVLQTGHAGGMGVPAGEEHGALLTGLTALRDTAATDARCTLAGTGGEGAARPDGHAAVGAEGSGQSARRVEPPPSTAEDLVRQRLPTRIRLSSLVHAWLDRLADW